MAHKQKLITKLQQNPQDFSKDDIDALRSISSFSLDDVKPLIYSIFDIDESMIRNDSVASKGILGFFNKLSRTRRNRVFRKKIKTGRIKKVIVAEGDSWFEHPAGIKDIVDQFMRKKHYAVYSLAYAGDWIANIWDEREYIDALVKIKPDVFMVSGGGNDILDNCRLARLIHDRSQIESTIGSDPVLDTDEEKQQFSDLCLNDRFHTLMKLFSLLYRSLYDNVSQKVEHFEKMKIITQGYDYGIPSRKKGLCLLRWAEKSGNWLHKPLVKRGYKHKDEQQAIIFGMINHFNDMLIETGADLEGVVHMDLRGTVKKFGKWFDEIHPSSGTFEKIAEAFRVCIESEDKTRKVFIARDLV